MQKSQSPMTDDQRRGVILEYFRRLDLGEDWSDLVDDGAVMYFPKWGIAEGREKIREYAADIGQIIASISHHRDYFNWAYNGDVVMCEGTSNGVTSDGVEWRAGVSFAGRWCDVFEVRDFKIHRAFTYLDPDYWDRDTARYPWLTTHEEDKDRRP